MTQQKCNSPNCNLIAEYRAPLSPNNLKEYQWFCLKHIKEYNKSWNYFENMSADEIEEFIENDIIGHRKTHKIGANRSNYFNKTNEIRENIFNSFNHIGNEEFSSNSFRIEYTNALAELNINDKIKTISNDPNETQLSEVNIVTNSGLLRPIGNFIISRLNPKAVISLMWETW